MESALVKIGVGEMVATVTSGQRKFVPVCFGEQQKHCGSNHQHSVQQHTSANLCNSPKQTAQPPAGHFQKNSTLLSQQGGGQSSLVTRPTSTLTSDRAGVSQRDNDTIILTLEMLGDNGHWHPCGLIMMQSGGRILTKSTWIASASKKV